MADRIIFENNINDSVQVGDELWYSADLGSGQLGIPTIIGTITGIGKDYVEVADTLAPSHDASNFFIFRKPEHNNYTNMSSLKGYYAKVRMSSSYRSDKIELFAVGSEVTESSK
tara:strand:- start:313 stop:654 length:342 start_codon:yes stop_codon:yes gene_type:complete